MSHKTLRMMLLSALFAALTAIGAFIRLPAGPTSITLQFLFSALAGILLGVKWGTVSQLLYVGLGLLGLIPSTAVIAGLTRRSAGRVRLFFSCLLGDLVLYLFGVPYMYLISHAYGGSSATWLAIWASMLVFVPGDLLKLAVLTAVGPVLRRRLAGFVE